ncbi:MAG: glycosyl transferase [Gammaproteobacteria bacterium]|nr:glycosyl transferase [Gammaproteobacteria bacterium]
MSSIGSRTPGRGRAAGLRVMLHVQHLLGTGHLFRTLAIARALAAIGAKVRVLSGGPPVAGIAHDGVELLQLPAAQVLDASFDRLVGSAGEPLDERWRAARVEATLSAFDGFAPQVLVTETFPFGRGLLRFELQPLMQRARSASFRPMTVSSFRDILEKRSRNEQYERMARLVEEWFDAILIHADPDVTPFEASFPLCARIAHKLFYTGYVVGDASAEGDDALPARPVASGFDVVVSAGGGRFGIELLRTAAACAGELDLAWLLLVGPQIDESAFQALRQAAPANATVSRNRPDFQRLLRHARVSVSQAGYNTVTDILRARIPAVLVPFSDGRQMEQPMRAATLQARGLASVIAPADLSVGRLREALRSALMQAAAVSDDPQRGAASAAATAAEPTPEARPGSRTQRRTQAQRTSVRPIRLDGARASAELIVDLLHARGEAGGNGN